MTIEAGQTAGQTTAKTEYRTSRDELLKLAKEAGKLGITGVENIRRFVEQADKINVSLGEDERVPSFRLAGQYFQNRHGAHWLSHQ